MQKHCCEIGSEFWLDDIREESSCVHVLSGRTAIDLIIQDVKAMGCQTQRVYMPAWCCDSMLQPFKDRLVDIDFYDVSWESGVINYEIDTAKEVDILYLTNYFGYSNTLPIETIIDFKRRGAIIVYDRTHSLFREDSIIECLADYTFGSIRKWISVVSGAYLEKKDGQLNLMALSDCPYISYRKEAMKLKASYMSGDNSIYKQEFLDKYSRFGHLLEEDYWNYRMDEQSLNLWQYADKKSIKKRRCANALALEVCLLELPQVQPMFKIKDGDCPLFVPVLLSSKEERDTLRRHLTSHAIYCPIHWPKPSLISKDAMAYSIYDRELSLLCDQRYGFDDMLRIINTIKEFY